MKRRKDIISQIKKCISDFTYDNFTKFCNDTLDDQEIPQCYMFRMIGGLKSNRDCALCPMNPEREACDRDNITCWLGPNSTSLDDCNIKDSYGFFEQYKYELLRKLIELIGVLEATGIKSET